MSALTPERLAGIRDRDARAEWFLSKPVAFEAAEEDRAALLAHVDHLTAENARLREGVAAFATDAASFGDHAPRCSDRNCLHDYSIRNQRRAAALLNPPTEGEADHE